MEQWFEAPGRTLISRFRGVISNVLDALREGEETDMVARVSDEVSPPFDAFDAFADSGSQLHGLGDSLSPCAPPQFLGLLQQPPSCMGCPPCHPAGLPPAAR